MSEAAGLNEPFSMVPQNIPWDEVHPDGTKSATLNGTRDPGVAFTYAFFLPAGFWDQPHSHVADARVFVVSGELRLAYGGSLDKAAADRYPAGSYLFVPAGAVHFDGAEEDTTIVGVAVGPWSTDYA
jgi:quercetin dioxygenase-like cupin family protein